MHKNHAAPFLLSLLVFFLTSLYYFYFSEALDHYEWLGIDGFTRIVIPDTFVYKDVIDFSDFLGSVVDSGVKNTLGPSLLWFIANGNWITVLFFNAVFLFFTLRYIIKISVFIGLDQHKALTLIVLIALLPATIYNSVGALKEIPGLFFLTAFFYHYLKNEHAKWLLYAFLCVLFRFQVVFVLSLFLVFDRFQRRALIYSFYALIFLSIIYPFINKLEVLYSDTTASYREQYGIEGSIGGIVESVRETMPVISVIAILIRIFQSIFEPIINLAKTQNFYEDSDISLISIAYFFSSLILLRFWFIFLKNLTLFLTNSSNFNRDVFRLYMLCLIFIFPIAGFSFIHHRYLYPVTALLLVAGAIHLRPIAWEANHKLQPS